MEIRLIAWIALCILWIGIAVVGIYQWKKWYDAYCLVVDINEREKKYYSDNINRLQNRIDKLTKQIEEMDADEDDLK